MPPDGRVEMPLDEDEVRAAAELFAKRGIDAVIVGFLFSFLNNEHERGRRRSSEAVMPDAYRLLLVRGREHDPRVRAVLDLRR